MILNYDVVSGFKIAYLEGCFLKTFSSLCESKSDIQKEKFSVLVATSLTHSFLIKDALCSIS